MKLPRQSTHISRLTSTNTLLDFGGWRTMKPINAEVRRYLIKCGHLGALITAKQARLNQQQDSRVRSQEFPSGQAYLTKKLGKDSSENTQVASSKPARASYQTVNSSGPVLFLWFNLFSIHELAQQRPRVQLVLRNSTIPALSASPTKKWDFKNRPA